MIKVLLTVVVAVSTCFISSVEAHNGPERLELTSLDDLSVSDDSSRNDPVIDDPLEGPLEEQIEKLKELLKKLPKTNCFGLSRGKVWDDIYYWLKGLGFPSEILPGDLEVLSPEKPQHKERIDDFLRELKEFLKNKNISTVRALIGKLRARFAGRADLIAILDEILRLIEGLDGNIPQFIIDLIHDLIKELIFAPENTKTALSNSTKTPCWITAEEPIMASID